MNETTSNGVENDNTFLIIYVIVMSLQVASSTTLITLLVLRKDMQPLKKKCSRLILLSVIGNTLFGIIANYQQIIYNVCSSDVEKPICNHNFFNKFNCLIGFMLLSICEPLAVVP